MRTVSIRLPSSILTRISALRGNRGWALGEILEKSIDLAKEQPSDFSRYLSSYHTLSGKRRGKARTVINTSISDNHERAMRELPANGRTVAEILNAAIRQFLDSLIYRPDDPERIFDETPLEIFFPVKSMEVEKFRRRETLSSIPPSSLVVVDSSVFLYAYVRVGSDDGPGWKPDEGCVSRECLHLIRRIRNGELIGYTTPGELNRLFEHVSALDLYSEMPERTIESDRLFIASILKAGFHLLPEDSATVLRAIALEESYQDSMFLAAASFLLSDHLYIATASNSISESHCEIPIRTPGDLPPEGILTAP